MRHCALIVTGIFDQVQFMWWRDAYSLYANDLYYSATLGLDGVE